MPKTFRTKCVSVRHRDSLLTSATSRLLLFRLATNFHHLRQCVQIVTLYGVPGLRCDEALKFPHSSRALNDFAGVYEVLCNQATLYKSTAIPGDKS